MKARILVVEDNALVALELVQALHLAAFEVVGPATTVALALEFIAAEGCDAAVLDINLGNETSEAVALELKRWHIPFVTVSGYSQEQHPPVFRGAPALVKPLRHGAIIEELSRCLEMPQPAGICPRLKR
jgi:DNA-binding NarL/FixJ family response regulator